MCGAFCKDIYDSKRKKANEVSQSRDERSKRKRGYHALSASEERSA